MLPKWLTALLVMLQEMWSTRRDAQIRFLKLQAALLKERLPGNRPPRNRSRPPIDFEEVRPQDVSCLRWLVGLLKH